MSSSADGQASHKPDFLIVMRGYDRNQVDTYFGQVRSQFDRALDHIRGLEDQLTALKMEQERAAVRQMEHAEDLPAVAAKPEPEPVVETPHLTANFAEVGMRVGVVLQAAEEEARKVREQAHNQAAQIVQEAHQQGEQSRDETMQLANEQIQALHDQAHAEIQALREEHEQQIAARLLELDHQAEQVMADARQHAQQAQEAALAAEQQREQTLAQMQEQATEMIESAQRRAAEQADQILTHADAEHERLIREAQQRVAALDELAQTQQQQRQELASRAYELATQLQEVATSPIFAEALDTAGTPAEPSPDSELSSVGSMGGLSDHRDSSLRAPLPSDEVDSQEAEVTGRHAVAPAPAALVTPADGQDGFPLRFADEMEPQSAPTHPPTGPTAWMRPSESLAEQAVANAPEPGEADQRTVVYYGSGEDDESTQVVPVVTVMPVHSAPVTSEQPYRFASSPQAQPQSEPTHDAEAVTNGFDAWGFGSSPAPAPSGSAEFAWGQTFGVRQDQSDPQGADGSNGEGDHNLHGKRG